jgi:phospholipid/cholesterol/gamma-HCH transport system ATP-binding protein
MTVSDPSIDEKDILIELRDVTARSVTQPHLDWIRNWDWTIKRGERWLVGAKPDSGKTSLLSVAAGLVHAHQGTVRIFDREVQDLEPESWLDEKLRMGMVFEDGGKVFQELSVFENLMLPLNYHERLTPDERRAHVQSILESTEMDHIAGRSAAGLSRNWKQRLGLARALVLQPEVLFLDNPLGAVDTHHGLWWLKFLDHLVTGRWEWQPKALVISANDLTPWMSRVNRLALINDRSWVEIDPSDRNTLESDPLIQSLMTAKI